MDSWWRALLCETPTVCSAPLRSCTTDEPGQGPGRSKIPVADPAASAAARVEELTQERDRAVAEAAELRRQNQSLREKRSSSLS